MPKIKPVLYFYITCLIIVITWYLLYSFGLSNIDFTEWKEYQRRDMFIYSGVSVISYYLFIAIKNFNSNIKVTQMII